MHSPAHRLVTPAATTTTRAGPVQYHSKPVHRLRTRCHYMSPATLRLGIEHLIQVTPHDTP